jgi:uncharacterized protein (DUF427 family)
MTMKAIWNGQVIAESTDTVVVEGNHYFPLESVNRSFLEHSPTTSVCPWKGTANYYSLRVNGARNAAQIAGRVAFWRGVQVVDS